MIMGRKVFYSFHYKKDVFRVQQVRNIGKLEDAAPVSPNAWEEIKRKGDKEIQKWIDENLAGKSCLVVLIGEDTANRRWIKYEIQKAWNSGKGVLGIFVHNLKDLKNGESRKGRNPFDQFKFADNSRLSNVVKSYDPDFLDAYNNIAENIEGWIEEAISIRKNLKFKEIYYGK